jgi:hypothetical protein
MHKFLTHYDPNSDRVFAFVEGEADEVFYRAQIHKYVADQGQIFIYNCDGKENVYDAYQDIIAKYPTCQRVLFVLDKDLDDIIGAQWPSDPRIFTTEYYSIENYVVTKQALHRYFKDYVKVRRVDIDLEAALVSFDEGLNAFHRRMLPVMAWIVVAKRSGARIVLNDLNPGEMLAVSGDTTARKSGCRAVAYLCRVCQANPNVAFWKLIRRTLRELQRLPAKSYVRGKFEAWWFVEFGQRMLEGLRRVVQEAGGSVRVSAQLHASTFVQLLAGSVTTPAALDKFLIFHTRRQPQAAADFSPEAKGLVRRIIDTFKGD